MILTEFDPSQFAVINPSDMVHPIPGFPKVAVSCFSRITLDRLVQELHGEVIAHTRDANTEYVIYKVSYNGSEFALFMSSVGAPTCIAVLEDMFTMGAEKIVLFGSCGVLDKNIGACSVIIPTSAIRDEGTSFHYAPPSEEIPVNPRYRQLFTDLLDSQHCSYTLGKVWTTDGVYRETLDKVQRRKQAGCICVDMECAAVAALAAFRNKAVFQFFYAADNLDKEIWDPGILSNQAKDRVAVLAMEMASRIEREEDYAH